MGYFNEMKVALKQLKAMENDEENQTFQNEVGVLSCLRHPVSVFRYTKLTIVQRILYYSLEYAYRVTIISS